MHKTFTYQREEPFILECGETLQDLKIQYTTYGTLNANHSNVVWVFHALTANSDPVEWWPGIVEKRAIIDPENYFIVCANMIGSCYGSTEPEDFDCPTITVRDVVNAHRSLKDHLGLTSIYMGIGGSMGGQQLLEWAVQEPDLFEIIVPLATNAKHSAWGIAFNEAQRMALKNNSLSEGLEAARSIAMLSYRHYKTYEETQTDVDDRFENFSASSYQQYQGKKLRQRFSPYSYFSLSKTMDSHNLGRYYGGIENALKRIRSRAIVIGVDTDILFPVDEQKMIAEYIPDGTFYEIESLYGHDGFLIETEQITRILEQEIKKGII